MIREPKDADGFAIQRDTILLQHGVAAGVLKSA